MKSNEMKQNPNEMCSPQNENNSRALRCIFLHILPLFFFFFSFIVVVAVVVISSSYRIHSIANSTSPSSFKPINQSTQYNSLASICNQTINIIWRKDEGNWKIIIKKWIIFVFVSILFKISSVPMNMCHSQSTEHRATYC